MLKKIEGIKNIKLIGTVTTKENKTISVESSKRIDIKGKTPLVTYLSPVGTIVDESPEIEFEVSDDGEIDLVQVRIDGREVKCQKLKVWNPQV